MKSKLKAPLKGKVLGILGGIGPESSAIFYQRLIKIIQERHLVRNNVDYPRIIINSIPAPELFLEKTKDQLSGPYLEGVKDLNKEKLDLIVIVCNTAYKYLEEFNKISKAPLLNLIEEVKNRLNYKQKYYLLGSSLTIKSKIFSFENIDISCPNNAELKLIDDVIFSYNKSANVCAAKKDLMKIVKKHQKEGKKFILGCTEISLLLEKELPDKIDTFEVMLGSTLEKLQNARFINR